MAQLLVVLALAALFVIKAMQPWLVGSIPCFHQTQVIQIFLLLVTFTVHDDLLLTVDLYGSCYLAYKIYLLVRWLPPFSTDVC